MTKKSTKKVATKVAKVEKTKTMKQVRKVLNRADKIVKDVKGLALQSLKAVTTSIVETTPTKSVLVDPAKEYTKAEVRAILRLSKNTHMTETKGYIGFEGKGGIKGEAVIAFLPKSKKVKVGRKYPSGKVSVVAR